jgi:hypothetical protein
MEYDGLAPTVFRIRDDSCMIHSRGCEGNGGYIEAVTESPAIIKFKCRQCGETWTLKEIEQYLVSKGAYLMTPD